MNIEEQNLLALESEKLRVQDLCIEVVHFIPILFVFFVFYISLNSLVSLFLFQFLLSGSIYLYLRHNSINLLQYVKEQLLDDWRKGVFVGVPMSLIVYLVFFGGFWGYWEGYQGKEWILEFRFLFPDSEIWYIIAFPIFTLCTPFLSELYWRTLPINTVKQPKIYRMCFYYGFFHGMIVNLIKDSFAGLAFFVFYSLFAWLLTFLKQKFGLLAAILTHIGLNLGISLMFILIIKEQKSLFS